MILIVFKYLPVKGDLWRECFWGYSEANNEKGLNYIYSLNVGINLIRFVIVKSSDYLYLYKCVIKKTKPYVFSCPFKESPPLTKNNT